MRNAACEINEIYDYYESGDIFQVKVLDKKTEPLDENNKDLFLKLRLLKLDTNEIFAVEHLLNDAYASVCCWRLYPRNTYIIE